ncbi:hypothetical protein EBR16_08115, partial [bacterium]|nr:hypothetical protein [bacterium]
DGRGSLGVFRRAEVEAGLATGRFAGTVLSWREGEPGWVALASRPEFGAARSAFATLQPATTPAFEVGGRLLARGFLRRCARTWVDVLFRPTATFVPFREPAGIRLAWIWLLLATALAVPLVFFLGQATLTAFLRAIGRSVDVRTALGGAWLLGCVAWCLAISPLIPRAFPVGGGLVGLSGLLGLGFLLTLGRALALAHGDAGWKPGLALVALICLGCCGAAIVIPFVLYPFFAQLGG